MDTLSSVKLLTAVDADVPVLELRIDLWNLKARDDHPRNVLVVVLNRSSVSVALRQLTAVIAEVKGSLENGTDIECDSLEHHSLFSIKFMT
jgi:hypothetical protein